MESKGGYVLPKQRKWGIRPKDAITLEDDGSEYNKNRKFKQKRIGMPLLITGIKHHTAYNKEQNMEKTNLI